MANVLIVNSSLPPSTVPPLTITSGPTLGYGQVGAGYAVQLFATGGTNSGYVWALVSASPDTGSWITIDSGTGILHGTPTTAEVESITVRVTDSASNTTTKVLSLTVAPGQTMLAYIKTLGLNAGGVMTGQTIEEWEGANGNGPLWGINTANANLGWGANPTIGSGSSQTATGYLPCVINVILYPNSSAPNNVGGGGGSYDNFQDTTNGILAIAQGTQSRNLIFYFCWCPSNPAGTGNNPWPAVITPGTATYNTYVGWLNTLAGYLKQLTKPFIFAPVGELNLSTSGFSGVNNNWGTIGQCTSAQAAALYQLQFNTLTSAGVTNCLWVFQYCFGQGNPSFGYPGPAYVDLIAGDTQPASYTNSSDYTWGVSQGLPFYIGSILNNSGAGAYTEDMYNDTCTLLGHNVSNADGINGYPAAFAFVEWGQGGSYGQALNTSVVSSLTGTALPGSAKFLNNTNLPTFSSAGGVAGG